MRPLLFAIVAIWAFPLPAARDDLQLWVDVDGTAYLHNTTTGPVSFDGYQIVSKTKNLDPVAWDSISDRVPARITDLLGALGNGGLTFGEAGPTEIQLAELNLPGVGTLAAGAKFSLGKLFKSWSPHPPGDCFFWSAPGTGGGGVCLPTPEPSSLVLAGTGLVGAMGLRRHRRAA